MGKLTHLEAFTSDDAKRGRVWTDGHDEYKRSEDRLYQKYYRNSPSSFWWEGTNKQVAAMEGTVTWADEPKTLTTQEAARALADGKCISASDHLCESSVIRLSEKFGMVCWTRDYHRDVGYRGGWFWDVTSVSALVGYHIAPDPSQPADRAKREWNPLGKYEDMPQDIQEDIKTERGWAKHEPTKPPLKIGDRVKRRWYATKDVGRVIEVDFTKGDGAIQIQWNECVGAYPNDSDLVLVEAEPQVEYPLTYAEAVQAAMLGNIVTWRDGNLRGALFRYVKGAFEASFDSEPRCFAPIEWTPTTGELAARWRIVEEGKCRCARHDCVTCGATQTEGK